MPPVPSFTDAAVGGRLGDLHGMLLELTRDHDEAPRDLLAGVGERLRDLDVDGEGLTPRPLVALRLLAADALDAAWLVLQDNAIGVVEEAFRQSTSSGVRRTSRRLPLITRVEPPHVYAWLPGFRDPRHGAPDAAYDITALVTPRVRLDEMWWDGATLVLAGSAHLRNLTATEDDAVAVVLTHTSGRQHVSPGERRRRPDLVRGTGADLTRLAWAGWSARVDTRALTPGGWRVDLRVTQSGVERDAPLGRTVGEAVPTEDAGLRSGRRTVVVAGRRLEVRVVAPLAVRARRKVLHVIAHRGVQR